MNRTPKYPIASSTACMLAALAVPVQAQNAPTGAPAASQVADGSITGHVLDPATGNYLKNATVIVEAADGRRRSAISGEGGEYRVAGIPAGSAKVTIEYIGYENNVASIEVVGDRMTQHDVELVRPGGGAGATSDVVVTASFLEGDARAIMDQRQSMDIKNNLSTDSYGDISDDNPAEFLKFMPGVDIDGTFGTALNVQLRGMPSNMTGMTFDGLDLARADVSTGAGGSRTFSFDSANMGGMESIEISKTTSADVAADSPAGTINIRSARAFNRKKRRLILQVSGSAHAGMWDSYRRTGPSEGGYGGRRFLPNGSIQYAQSFFDRRLGVSASISKTNLYIEREAIYNNRSYVPTLNSPEPMAITSIELHDEPRVTSRFSTGVAIDFKASDDLILSWNTNYYRNTIWKSELIATVTTGARSRGVVGEPLFDFTTLQTPTANTLTVDHSANMKISKGFDFVPGFEFNRNGLRIEGKAFYSKSRGYYDLPGLKGQVSELTSAVTSRGNFSVSRTSDFMRQDFTVQQVGGGDWSEAGSFTLSGAPTIRTNAGGGARVVVKGGKGDVTWTAELGELPFELKTGFLVKDKEYQYRNTSDLNIYRYAGSMTNAEFLAAVRSSNQISVQSSGSSLTSINGSDEIYYTSPTKIGALYLSNPDQWVNVVSATNWYNAYVANNRDFSERSGALYGMATVDAASWLKLRGGLRWERTQNSSVELDALSPQEVTSAGFAVSASTGRATTIPGLEYQFHSRPSVQRKRDYSHFFPSASAKFSISKDLTAHVGYSRTITRPEISVLAGVWSIDETDRIIRAPNPGLDPAISDNLSGRLAYFFEPVSMIAVDFYMNRVNGLFQSQELTAAEYGNTDPRFDLFTFITTARVPGDAVNIRGVEVELNHSMSYLPGLFSGLSVRGSFMYNDPDVPIVRVANKVASFSVSYKKGPVQLFFNSFWNDHKYRSVTPSYFYRRLEGSLSGQLQITKQVETFFSIRNLFNTPVRVWSPGYVAAPTGVGDFESIRTQNGRSGTFGLRARF